MNRRVILASLSFTWLTVSSVWVGCSNSPGVSSDAGHDTSVIDAPPDNATSDSGGMTIAKARQAFVDAGTSSAITVNAIVTAVQGSAGDQVIWYVEDPAGGPYSGISVFCDPLAATTCPCMASCTPHVAAPALGTLVSITGTISAYHGQVQLEPTA